jgi:hypothetical protein
MFSTDCPEVPVHHTKADDVFNAFQTIKDELMHIIGMIRKGTLWARIHPDILC